MYISNSFVIVSLPQIEVGDQTADYICSEVKGKSFSVESLAPV